MFSILPPIEIGNCNHFTILNIVGVLIKRGFSLYTPLSGHYIALNFCNVLQIRQSNLDVICLQEVWRTDIQRLIAQSVKPTYPYSISLIDLDKPSTSMFTCSRAEVLSYHNCTRKCKDVVCLIRDCSKILRAVPYECMLCMLLNVLPGNPEQMLDCITDPATSYERSFGLMVLSRKKPSNVEVEGFLGNVSEARGYIKASVSFSGIGRCIFLE